jgi:hypothetical protein
VRHGPAVPPPSRPRSGALLGTASAVVLLTACGDATAPPASPPQPVRIEVRENIRASDETGTLAPIAISVLERVTLRDEPQVGPTLAPVVVSIHEVVGLADASRFLTQLSVHVHETVVLTDQPQVRPPVGLVLHETIVVADGHKVLPPVSIEVTETIQVTDAAQVTLN